jgi:hypothetical protein
MPIATVTSRVGAFFIASNQEPFSFFIEFPGVAAAGIS